MVWVSIPDIGHSLQRVSYCASAIFSRKPSVEYLPFLWFSIGTGDASVTQQARTAGAKPILPDVSEFIVVSVHTVTLQLTAWKDGGCPMLYFVIEYQKK